MTSNITIGLDQSHNNMLTLEASSYSEFTHFLFASGYKIVRIENGFVDKEKLKDYNLIIISSFLSSQSYFFQDVVNDGFNDSCPIENIKGRTHNPTVNLNRRKKWQK